MTVPSVLLYFVLIGTAAVAYWILFVGSTGKSRAGFRTELWQLRDRIVDEAILNKSRPSKAAFDLLEAVESCIRQSEQFTAFRVFSFYTIWQHAGSPIPPGKLDLTPGGDEDTFREYKLRLASICTKHLFTNSVPGPVTFAIPTALLLRRLLSRKKDVRPKPLRTRDMAARPIRVDVQGEAWANRSHDELSSATPV